jgi:DNA-binding NarL/FixJ family response regulator
MSKITVLLADDHPIMRPGIAAILAAESDVEIVGEAEDGAQAVALAEQIHPRVVIMDIAMPVMNGIEATRQIVSRFPETRVLVLSSYTDTETVSELTAAGASGFIAKFNASSELVDSIRHTAA